MVYFCSFLLLFVRRAYFQTTLNPGGYEIPNITLRIIWPGSKLYQQFDFRTALADSQPFKRVGCFHGTVIVSITLLSATHIQPRLHERALVRKSHMLLEEFHCRRLPWRCFPQHPLHRLLELFQNPALNLEQSFHSSHKPTS